MNKLLKNKNYSLFVCALSAILLLTAFDAKSQNPTAPALGFNVFLKNGATLINNETEGPVAMGGDLTLSQNSYQVSTNYTGTFTVSGVKVTLVIGGKVNFNGGNGLTVDQNGYIKIGDCGSSKTWYTDQNNANSPIRITPGSDYNGSPRINLQANAQQLGVSAANNPVCQGNLIDFAAAFTTMKATSASISACTDNTSLTNANGNTIAHTGLPNQVKINLATGINTLNLSGTDMNNVTDFIYNNKPDANHILVINVNAPGTFNWSVYNSGGIGFGECPYILYNFYNTTTLNIQGNGAVEGTVFAPYADIVKTANQSNIEGQIIAQSYIHNGGENHYPPFNANIPGCGNVCNVSATETHVNASTYQGTDGSINLTVTGGSAPYTYLWNDGNTNEDRTGLKAGTYSVTVTDKNSCTTTATVIITQPSSGNCTGFKTYTQGGWGAKANGNNPGVYRDANFAAAFPNGLTIGCTNGNKLVLTTAKAVEDFLPSGSTAAVLPSGTLTNPAGNYNNVLAGQLEAAMLNVGFDAYDAGFSTNSTHTGDLFISSGTFAGKTISQLLTIANDVIGGCSTAYSPADLNTALTSFNENYDNGTADNGYTKCAPTCTIAISGTKQQITCHDSNNGSINITVSGNNGAVTYLWNDGVTTEDRTGLAAGTYSVTATDAAKCTISSETFTISNPSAINAGGNAIDVTTVGGTNGSIHVTVTGGTGTYTYLWNDGATTEDRTGLTAGNYAVTVTDINGCTKDTAFTIHEPNCTISIAGTKNDITCHDAANGSINITVSGNYGVVTYFWNDGVTTEDRTGLAAGTYSVTVTDAAKCTISSETFTISNPSAISAGGNAIDVTTVGGTNGSIDVTVTGGTGTYTYLWNDEATTEGRTGLTAGNYSVTVSDANGCTKDAAFTIHEPNCTISIAGTMNDITCHDAANAAINITVSGNNGVVTYLWNDGVTTEDRTGLAAGTYSVTATDATKCTISSETFKISNPSVISAGGNAIDVTTVGGTNGSIDVTVTGGTGTYTYLWNDGATTEDRTGLTAGNYAVTVTDANGCTKDASFTIHEPNCTISIVGTKNDITCHDAANGSINITVSGNNGAVTYLWNDGETTEDRTGLAAGTYSLTATDAAKCTISSETFTISNPSAISAGGTVINVTTVGGNNGSIDVTVTGGTGTYAYLWNDGATTEDRTGLAAGNYSITVTDENGCAKDAAFTVQQPGCKIAIKGTVTNVSCYGGNNGAINVTVTGNSGAVTYLWNDAVTTEDRTNLIAGSYSVIATDKAGCKVTSPVYTVKQPKKIVIKTAVTPQKTKTNCDGTATVTVTGGTAPYTIKWNDGFTGASRTGLCAGTYTITVTDKNGCGATCTVKIQCKSTQPSISSSEQSSLSAGSVAFNVTVSPNPTRGLIRVSLTNETGSNATVTVFDLSGKAMLTNKVNLSKGTNYSEMDLSSFARGAYLVQIVSDNNKKTVKIILE